MIIGIIHHPDNKLFLKDLLQSIKGATYPIYIVANECSKGVKAPYKVIYNPEGGYELGALKKLLEVTKDEDIFLIQDSFVVKNLELFDIAANHPGSLATSSGFFHYTGKYKRSILEKIGFPIPKDKREAIQYEHDWNEAYALADPDIAMLPDYLHDRMDSARYEQRHGRLNLVLENEYLTKYKGTWR